MKRVITSSDAILCMSNVRGKYVKNPHSLPFSFYFSSGSGVSHGPRVKVLFNPEKLKLSLTGNLKLCDDWEFIPGKQDNVNAKGINDMKSFFRKYLVLFCAVWDEQIGDGDFDDYLKGMISFDSLLENLDFYEEYEDDLKSIHDVESLEDFCRSNNLVNMYGN